jgi:hypothetical protein
VEAAEKKLIIGDGRRWIDVEADEATFTEHMSTEM